MGNGDRYNGRGYMPCVLRYAYSRGLFAANYKLLKKELVVLLEGVRLACGRDFKLFSVKELSEMGGDGVTEERATDDIKRLAAAGYLDVRYIDEKQAIIKPLDKDFFVDDGEGALPQTPAQNSGIARLTPFIVCAAAFVCAFIGAFLGALAAVAIC